MRERIGTGLNSLVYGIGLDKVVKLPRNPLCRSCNNCWGEVIRKRADHDLQLLRKYFGEYLLQTRVRKTFGGIWFIEQERIPSDNLTFLSWENFSPFKKDLAAITAQSRIMRRETGYDLNLCFNGILPSAGIIRKTIGEKDYWILPSLVVVQKKGEGSAIKILDTGLLCADPSRRTGYSSPHEIIAWQAQQRLLEIIQRKSGINF